MKCLYKELTRIKKYLIAKLWNEIAGIEHLWFQAEIRDEEYGMRYDQITARIRELEG